MAIVAPEQHRSAPGSPPFPARVAHGTWQALRHRSLSPERFRLASGLAVVSLGFIIVSGAAVRLTGSGLGCLNWPGCTSTQLVAPLQFHAWVEFGNRLVTGAVSLAVVLAVLAAVIRAPRRRDLTVLSLGLVVGLLAEIVLGALTVEHKLAPGFVTAHFLLAVVFFAEAVVLHHRSGLPDGPPVTLRRARAAGRSELLVSREQLLLARLLVVACAIVVLLGTVVTSTGPHGGAPQARRFAFSLHDVAQLHGSAVEVFLFFTVLTVAGMARSHAPRAVLRKGEVLLVAVVVQGAIGYLQYFTGVPAGLVAFHIVGAVTVVWATLRFYQSLHSRVAGPVLADLTPSTAVVGRSN